MWSRIGSRASYGMAALELGKKYDDLMILTADTSTSAGLDRFKKMYPEKYLFTRTVNYDAQKNGQKKIFELFRYYFSIRHQ